MREKVRITTYVRERVRVLCNISWRRVRGHRGFLALPVTQSWDILASNFVVRGFALCCKSLAILKVLQTDPMSFLGQLFDSGAQSNVI